MVKGWMSTGPYIPSVFPLIGATAAFQSCGEKEQEMLECASPCKVPDVISAGVRGWNAEVCPDWKMWLHLSDPGQTSAPSTSGLWLDIWWEHEVNVWQTLCWWKLCVHGNGRDSLSPPQHHCFYGGHVTVCVISLPQTCKQPKHQCWPSWQVAHFSDSNDAFSITAHRRPLMPTLCF